MLCDAFDIPLLYLCDTPGIMVGPEIEKTALVRHSSRMFLAGANVQAPFLKIILRKAYGLGAIAMSGGADDAAVFTVSWPTGEFGPMALEGAAKLGYRNELAAIADPAERKKRFDEMVAELYQRGKALNIATHFAIDDVIDPADSRRWIAALAPLDAGSDSPHGQEISVHRLLVMKMQCTLGFPGRTSLSRHVPRDPLLWTNHQQDTGLCLQPCHTGLDLSRVNVLLHDRPRQSPDVSFYDRCTSLNDHRLKSCRIINT